MNYFYLEYWSFTIYFVLQCKMLLVLIIVNSLQVYAAQGILQPNTIQITL